MNICRFFLGLLCFLPLWPVAAFTATGPPLEVMAGQMLMAGFRGLEIDAHSQIIADLRDRYLGGVILFDMDMALQRPERNIRDPLQLVALTAALQAQAAVPLFIAVDQEGGRVQRLKPANGFSGTPSARTLGRADNASMIAAGDSIARILHDSGINLNFAPVVDLEIDPDSPAIGRLERSFSSNPERVTHCAQLMLEALARKQLVGCLKHFPGHGSAGMDSHKGMTDVTQTWSAVELLPYEHLIAAGQVDMVMIAHIFNQNLDPVHPATLSHRVVTGLLREKLGFDGVVISDDMNMRAITDSYGLKEAVRLAIEAGVDILLFGNNLVYDPHIVERVHEIILQLVAEKQIPEERIRRSFQRIMRLKEKLAATGCRQSQRALKGPSPRAAGTDACRCRHAEAGPS